MSSTLDSWKRKIELDWLGEGDSVYIAGPMRGYPRFNFDSFEEATDTLRRAGLTVYSPHEHDLANGFNPDGESLDGWDARRAIGWDMRMCVECDHIAMLAGWQSSRGASTEARVASMASVPVLAYSSCEQIHKEEIWAGFKGSSIEQVYDVWIDKLPEEKSILAEADSLVRGDRNCSYGPPNQDFDRTAQMWNALFAEHIRNGGAFENHHIAMAMACLKLSRLAWSPTKRDSWVDLAGYADCGWNCAKPKEG